MEDVSTRSAVSPASVTAAIERPTMDRRVSVSRLDNYSTGLCVDVRSGVMI